jgi:hypothetical protein
MASPPSSIGNALLIGINYRGQEGQLSGCALDVADVIHNICKPLGYALQPASNVLESVLLERSEVAAFPFVKQVLTDNGIVLVSENEPTRKNIENHMAEFVAKIQPGKFALFHFSGHGAYVQAGRGRGHDYESDGRDETICPVDYASRGMFVDDYLHANFILPLERKRCPAFIIMDCCHSGTAMDLPYTMHIPGSARSTATTTTTTTTATAPRLDTVDEILDTAVNQVIRDKILRCIPEQLRVVLGDDAVSRYVLLCQQQPQQPSSCPATVDADATEAAIVMETHPHSTEDDTEAAPGKRRAEDDEAEDESSGTAGQRSASTARIIMVSGCRDNQVSADAYINNRPSGALTYVLLETLKPYLQRRRGPFRCSELLLAVHNEMKRRGFAQRPVLSSNLFMTASTLIKLY